MKNPPVVLLPLLVLMGVAQPLRAFAQSACDVCPGVPPPPAGWTTNLKPQCVDWAVYRTHFPRSPGDAMVWADVFPPCLPGDTRDCLNPVPARGTILIARANQNGAGA